MPDPVIQHSMASPSTVAWVMHQKFVNALPLYRQEKEWQTLGVSLRRTTMANWILVASRDWLTHVVERLQQTLVQERYLHADETTVQVMKEPGRKNTTDSYMWVYSSSQHAKYPIRIFEYQLVRSGKYPQTFLQGFQRYPHTDVYQGYRKARGITHCLCWAHVRRKFIDALPKSSPESTAVQGIAFCNKLFEG